VTKWTSDLAKQTGFSDIQLSEITVSNKSTVAMYKFSTAFSGKQTAATSDTPTASGCRPFRATSLSRLPSVLDQV
jgi:hypothetical protein